MYSAVYATRNATYVEATMFIVPANHYYRAEKFLAKYVRLFSPTMLPANMAPTNIGVFSMPFMCAASVLS
jgi:hypothetical protein